MCGTYRRDRFSSLVVIAVLVAIVLVAWITADPTSNAIGSPYADNVEHSQHSDIAHSIARDYHPWRDSYAQWLIAVLSIAATGVSIWAVKLVSLTLEENRKATRAAEAAVTEARRASDAQLRPYIVYDATKISVLQVEDEATKLLGMDISFRNCGLSPGILTAISNANYAPVGKGEWGPRESSWRPLRIVIGPGQTEPVRCSGIHADDDGNFTWFTVGILIWYENLAGTKYEETVWLTFNGTDMRQDYHSVSGQALYRPEQT